MELPVAPETYLPTAETMLRALRRAEAILSRMLAVETELPAPGITTPKPFPLGPDSPPGISAATLFTQPQLALESKANFAQDVHVPPGAGDSAAAVVDRILAHYAAQNISCHAISCAGVSASADLVAALHQRNYRSGGRDVLMRLEHLAPPIHPAAPLQIIPARSAYAPLTEFLRQEALEEYVFTAPAAAQRVAAYLAHLDEPRLTMSLGRVDNQIVATASVIDLGDVGIIDHVYTAPAYRRRGIASALLRHALDYCARAQFKSVLLEVRPERDAYRLYRSLGFVPVTEFEKYIRI